MRHVTILSGVSGIGKSTYIEKIMGGQKYATTRTWSFQFPENADRVVVSADHYFMVGDQYRFDPTKLTQAHAECFRAYIDFLGAFYDSGTVVVDNTNTTEWEISPYVLGAQAFGYTVSVTTLMCGSDADVLACAKRNAHGVPYEVVMGQHKRLQQRRLPPFWTQETITKLPSREV